MRNETNLSWKYVCSLKKHSTFAQSIKHQVYRIVQELIINVSRHANAKQVLLNFTKHDELLNIIIEDDGIGFTAGAATGIGFKNIQERLSALNGTMIIESVIGNGTTNSMDN